jgi:hypothetical protein
LLRFKTKRPDIDFLPFAFVMLTIGSTVARFFLVHDTKTGKNVPNDHKMLRMVIEYSTYKIFQMTIKYI